MLNQIFLRAAGGLADTPCPCRVNRPLAELVSWLVSAVFWLWIEKKLWFPGPFSKRKMKCACTFGWGSTCNVFRVRGVIVRMPYLPLRKVHWANSIWSGMEHCGVLLLKVSQQRLIFRQIFARRSAFAVKLCSKTPQPSISLCNLKANANFSNTAE